jgi:hypothetical protein
MPEQNGIWTPEVKGLTAAQSLKREIALAVLSDKSRSPADLIHYAQEMFDWVIGPKK